MFPLRLWFSILSLVAFAIVAIFLSLLYRTIAVNNIEALVERNNVALTQTFSNTLWTRYHPFFTDIEHVGDFNDLQYNLDTKILRYEIINMMKGTDVLKVKVYDLSGVVVFSTDLSQIGEYSDNSSDFLSAVAGKTASELTHRDTFRAFENEVEDKDIFSSYIPIYHSRSSKVQGVFEIYSDVTFLVSDIEKTQQNLSLGLASILTGLYLTLFAIVQRAHSILQSQRFELASQNQRLEGLISQREEMLDIAAHDMRSPLTTLGLMTEVLKKQAPSSFVQAHASRFEAMTRSINIMGSLIDEFLVAGRVESYDEIREFEPIDIYGAVADVILIHEVSAHAKDINLIGRWSRHKPIMIHADAFLLSQVLSNLLSNSIKYSFMQSDVVIEVVEELGFVMINFHDQGVGFASNEREKLFKKFSRLSGKPTSGEKSIGLGLYIVQKWVHEMRGTVSAESPGINQGATFSVKFPIVQNESEESTLPHSSFSMISSKPQYSPSAP